MINCVHVCLTFSLTLFSPVSLHWSWTHTMRRAREMEKGERRGFSQRCRLYRLDSDSLFPSLTHRKFINTKAGKERLFKNYLIHSVGNRDCQLLQRTRRDMENLSLCLTVSILLFHALSCSSTLYNLHLISISKIISLWVMHCRRSGEFVITWLWNRGNSPYKTQFRVVGRHFASYKFTKHTVTVMQRNEYSRMYAKT